MNCRTPRGGAMSYGYMFISRSDLICLTKIRGFNFYRLDSKPGWHALARHDHEGGKIIHPLDDKGFLTSFGQDVLKSVAGGIDVHFCFFLLDRRTTEYQILNHMMCCASKRSTTLPMPEDRTPIKLGAVYRIC